MMITGLMLDEDDNNGRSSYRQWRPWSRRPPARPAQLPYAHTSIEMMVMVKLVKMVMVMIIAYTSKYISRLNIENVCMSWGDKHTLATMMTMMMTVGIKDSKMYFKGQQRHASWECPHFLMMVMIIWMI